MRGPTHDNVLRCSSAKCGHFEPREGRLPDRGSKSWKCPVTGCTGRLTCRCGYPKGEGEFCSNRTRPGEGCRWHPMDGSKGAKSPQDRKGESGAGRKRRKKSKVESLPVKAKPPPPVTPGPTRVASVWAASYERAKRDPATQGALIHELSLLSAMTDDLNEQYATGESPGAWAMLARLVPKLLGLAATIREQGSKRGADGKPDPKAQRKAGEATVRLLSMLEGDLAAVVDSGCDEVSVRRELRETWKTRADLLRTKATMDAKLTEDTFFASLSAILIRMDRIWEPVFLALGRLDVYHEGLRSFREVLSFPWRRFELPAGVGENGNGGVDEPALQEASSP